MQSNWFDDITCGWTKLTLLDDVSSPDDRQIVDEVILLHCEEHVPSYAEELIDTTPNNPNDGPGSGIHARLMI